MVDKRSQWSTEEKVRIVLQTFNPQTSMAELCRQHNLVPRTVYGWKDRFLAAGRSGFDGSDAASTVRGYQKEIAMLKRIVGEYAVSNYALKKTLQGDKE